MDNTYLWAGAWAIITGIGIFMVFASISIPLKATTKRIMDESAGPRLGGVAEGNIVRALMVDMSKRIKPEGGDLDERLRRSGGFYKSVAEFHARRILASLVFSFLGIAFALGIMILLGVSVRILFVLIAGTVFAVLGFFYPDHSLNNAIRKRREQLRREMGFGLEKISLFLQSGSDLLEALAQTSGLGMFGQACGVIAAQAGTGRPISEVNSMVREELPITPEFDEFLQLVQTSIAKGQEIVEPFRQRAASMREMLRRDIIEEGHKASIRVTLLTSSVVLLATLCVVLLPLLIILNQEGLF